MFSDQSDYKTFVVLPSLSCILVIKYHSFPLGRKIVGTLYLGTTVILQNNKDKFKYEVTDTKDEIGNYTNKQFCI